MCGCWEVIADALSVARPAFNWIGDKLLAPALVAVVFSGLTNLLLERFKASRDHATKMTEELRADLRELQRHAAEYWSRAAGSGDAAIEARMVAGQSDVVATAAQLREQHKIEVFASADELLEFLDALTGGQFQSANRPADMYRVSRCVLLISKVRAAAARERYKRLRDRGR